jgi:hypothetical protein
MLNEYGTDCSIDRIGCQARLFKYPRKFVIVWGGPADAGREFLGIPGQGQERLMVQGRKAGCGQPRQPGRAITEGI